MEGHDLKNWREARGESQGAAADALGISRATMASYESGRRAIPPEIVAKALGTDVPVVEPKPRKTPIAGASIAQIAERARVELAEVQPLPVGVPKGARRPTAQEIREHPHRYDGPDIWVMVYDPPEKLKGGQTITRMIIKRPASGLGNQSVHLIGTCSQNNPDREALAPGIYRPFRASLGTPTPNGSGPPKGGQRKAA